VVCSCLDEAFGSKGDAGLFEAGDFGVGFAANGDEYTVEDFFLHVAILRSEGRSNAGTFVLDRSDRGVEQDSIEQLFEALVQRENEIAVGAGKQAGEHFDDRDARAQRGVNRAEFKADVPAADDQQATGNIIEIESAGGIHHARSIELQCWDNCRAGAGCDDDAVEGERFLRAVGFRNAQRG